MAGGDIQIEFIASIAAVGVFAVDEAAHGAGIKSFVAKAGRTPDLLVIALTLRAPRAHRPAMQVDPPAQVRVLLRRRLGKRR